jgi:hypothetical protein
MNTIYQYVEDYDNDANEFFSVINMVKKPDKTNKPIFQIK